MQRPELLSDDAGQSAARLIDEISRLFYLSRAVHVAAELGIADHMTGEPVTAASLAQKTGTEAAVLSRLMRFLAAYRIFEERSPDGFCNTELSSVLRDDHPQSVRANLRRIRAFWWSAVGDLEHTVRTGESAFSHVHGVRFFQYLRDNADIQRRFDDGMARVSDADDAAIASAYDFTRFERIVDVGGGRGGLLAQILTRAPNARGVLFDQPQVIAVATRLDDAGLSDRTEKIAGTFFDAVPGGADCYVIKGVLHDFDDGECVRILSNCRRAMRTGGHVLIANQDLPVPIVGPHRNLTMDIQMMTLLTGRERVRGEWAAIFRQAGLSIINSVETRVGFVLIDGIALERGGAVRPTPPALP